MMNKLFLSTALLGTVLVVTHCGSGIIAGDGTNGGGGETPLMTGIRQLGSPGVDTVSLGMDTTSTGALYVTGYTDGAFDGHAAIGTDALFLVQYDVAGNKIWSVLHGVTGSQVNSRTVVATPTGGAMLAGHTNAATLDGQTRTGTQDMFLTDYDSSGNLLWTRLLGGAGASVTLYSMVSDGSNAVYAVGSTTASVSGQTQTGTTDMLLVKYDMSGNKQWVRQLGHAGTSAQGITLALSPAKDAVYVVGGTGGLLSGGAMSGNFDAFVAKYDSSGNLSWIKQFGGGGASTTSADGAAVDSTGRLYVSGYTTGSTPGNTQAGNFDGYLAQFASDGTRNWITQFGVSGKPTNGGRCAIGPSDEIYVSGNTRASWDGSATPTYQAFMLSRFNSSGTRVWSKILNSSQGQVEDIALKPYGSSSIFVQGRTYAGLGGNTLAGTRDLFIARYDTDGNLK